MLGIPFLLFLLLGLLAGCTPEQQPRDAGLREDLIDVCVAWDAAFSYLRERGDTAALNPEAVRQAELVCGTLAGESVSP